MADVVFHNLDINNSNGQDGTALDVGRFNEKTIHFDPDGGTFDIEGSNDGSNWLALVSAINTERWIATESLAAGSLLPRAFKFIRIHTTTAGTAPAAHFFGRDPV